MQRILRFIAWLMLAALPLQGVAAASMRVCEAHSPVAESSHSPLALSSHSPFALSSHSPFALSLSKGLLADQGFDKLSPNGGELSPNGGELSPNGGELSPNGGVNGGVDGGGHSDHAEHAGVSTHASHDNSTPTQHSCVVCALCGHASAAPMSCVSFFDPPAPASTPGWVSVRLDSPSLPLPDKPPRA